MHSLTSHDAIQPSRSELKFTVSETQSAEIRAYLASRLRPDPNAVAGGYPVCSVYLDNQDALLLRQTQQGLRNRYKLRVRIYDDDPRHPAFLEIKRREGNSVKKQRARVDRCVASAILCGERLSPGCSSTLTGDEWTRKEWAAFQEFCRLRDQLAAVGTTYVYYRREAYVSPQNNSWRATFDRQLSASPFDAGEDLGIPHDRVPASPSDLVVFELKFTNRFPNWMRDLAQTFNLVAGPFPKYVTCRQRISPTLDAADAISEPHGPRLSRQSGSTLSMLHLRSSLIAKGRR